MARLQDFQSVTPSSSDNILIVQSTGQGLAPLNAVGQKVANDTTISSLDTTSKTIVGAINENKSNIDSKQDSLTFEGQAVTWNDTNVTGNVNIKYYYKYGRVVIAHLEFTPKSGRISNGNVICSGLPIPLVAYNCFGNNYQQMRLFRNGELAWYFPTDTTTLNRWDLNIAYFSET